MFSPFWFSPFSYGKEELMGTEKVEDGPTASNLAGKNGLFQ